MSIEQSTSSPIGYEPLSPALRSHETSDVSIDLVGSEVVLAGWVARRRDHGGVIFC